MKYKITWHNAFICIFFFCIGNKIKANDLGIYEYLLKILIFIKSAESIYQKIQTSY